jgi:hypothetical protein
VPTEYINGQFTFSIIKFPNSFFDKNTLQCMHEINQYQNGISHRAIHTDTIEYEKFTKHLRSKKQELLNKYPILEGRTKKKILGVPLWVGL